MANDIFDKTFSDQVVFDRIVDADRTITLAREAANKAEAAGQSDKAAILRAKADHLESILQATKTPDKEEQAGEPDLSDEEDDTEYEDDTEEDDDEDEDEERLPDDIADLKNVKDQSKDTDKPTNGHGSSSANNDSDSSAGASDETDKKNQDQNTAKNQDQNKAKNQDSNKNAGDGAASTGTGNKQSQQLDFDPFKRSMGGMGSQGKQLTREEKLAAIIKRLSQLSGNAKAGADRALKQLFDQVSDGTEALDD